MIVVFCCCCPWTLFVRFGCEERWRRTRGKYPQVDILKIEMRRSVFMLTLEWARHILMYRCFFYSFIRITSTWWLSVSRLCIHQAKWFQFVVGIFLYDACWAWGGWVILMVILSKDPLFIWLYHLTLVICSFIYSVMFDLWLSGLLYYSCWYTYHYFPTSFNICLFSQFYQYVIYLIHLSHCSFNLFFASISYCKIDR